jgi:hypothetical protein
MRAPENLPGEAARKPDSDWEGPAADFVDPVIEAYKQGVDRTLLRENLRPTPDERFRKFEAFMAFARELREAGKRHRSGEAR